MTNSHRLTQRLQFDFETTTKVYGMIAEIQALNATFSISSNLSHQTVNRLRQSVLVTSSGASNRIE